MRTIAIIGDSKGIGLALRQRLLDRGDKVIGVSRTGAQAEGNYTGLVFDAAAHPCDLSSFTDRLDGLVYCPGTINLKPVRGVKPEGVLEDFKVNAMGLLQTVQANLKLLKAAAADPIGGQPSIVGFSTVAVQTGMGFHASIAMAKGALEGLIRTMACEFAPDIRANAIAPSLTDTPLTARVQWLRWLLSGCSAASQEPSVPSLRLFAHRKACIATRITGLSKLPEIFGRVRRNSPA